MEIHFEIETECLLKCRHCSSFATEHGKKMNYNIKEMIAFLQIFPEKNFVFLTGGEPLLHDEIDNIIFSLKNKFADISIGIFTTGIVMQQGRLCGISERKAYDLSVLGLEMCYFSIYSAQAKKHDWMTQNKGSFELTLESIRRLREQNIEVKINLVITKINQEEIADIIALASSLGCTELRLLKLVNHGRAKKCWLDIGLTEQEYREIVIKNIYAYKDIKITASGCPDILPCRPFVDSQGCQAGSKLAYVTYEGKVFPCASTKNNDDYNIGKIDNITILKQYFEKNKLLNKISLCNR